MITVEQDIYDRFIEKIAILNNKMFGGLRQQIHRNQGLRNQWIKSISGHEFSGYTLKMDF